MHYFICATPRSGSTLLHKLLESTEVAGHCKEFQAREGSYKELMLEPTSNNVTSIKVMRESFDQIPRDVFKLAKHIWVRRKDKVYQAISLIRALKEDKWASDDGRIPKVTNPKILNHEIDAKLEWLVKQENEWEMIFNKLNIKPMTIWYEDLAATVETQGKIIISVLNFLEIKEKPAKWPPMAGITQQRDAYTEIVYQEYQDSKCGR